MRLTTTALLGLVAIVLALAIRRVDERPATGERAAARANVLMRFDAEIVDRIEIERGPAKAVLAKREGAWYFDEPEKDRADATLVAALLDKLNHLEIADTLRTDEEGLGPEQIGVAGDEAVRLRVSGGERDTKVDESVVVGVEAPRSGSVYMRRESGEKRLFVVDGNPRPWIERPLEAMRDRRLLGAPVASIVQLVIRQASGEISLQRRIAPPQQDWAIAEPLVAWADREGLDRLLSEIAALRIEEVVPDAPVEQSIPNPLPAGEIVFQFQVYGVETPLTIHLKVVEPGQDGTLPLFEARVSDRPLVYRFRNQILTSLPASANDLRDRTLARIPAEYLDSIWILSRTDPRVILKSERRESGMNWRVNLNNKLVAANSAEVAKLVAAINEAAIQDFASDTGENLAQFGLEPPSTQVTFNLRLPGEPLPDGSPGQVQDLSRVLKLGWKDGEQRLFANFEGEPYVYELDPTFMNLIPTHPVKWKSLNVLSFNPIHLVSITREMPEKEKLKLDYDYRRDKWEASRNGVDVTPSLDIAAARRLRDRLGSLTASGWYLTLGPAYEALQTPTVTFTIVTRELDRATNQSIETTHIVKLAPSATKVFFGQVESGQGEGPPDVFFLDEATYGDIIRHVTSSRAVNP